MAKTTRKTEPTTAVKKPAVRRPKAAAPVAGAETATTRRQTKTAPGAAPVAELTHDAIALRAWSIYLQRGASHGQAMSDWLEAKSQLLAERGLKA
ncbi:MAG: DUF2934 domain-containing protein [Vicinamibacterales bacterium]|jgi:hypothetical protein|nr:DUF2934 domain-containing protein [Vicinamibacterales bacterium]